MYNIGTDVPFNSCSFYKEHLSSETNRFGWFTWPKEKKGHVLAFFDINQSKTNNGREMFTLFAAVCTVLKWGTKILGNDHHRHRHRRHHHHPHHRHRHRHRLHHRHHHHHHHHHRHCHHHRYHYRHPCRYRRQRHDHHTVTVVIGNVATIKLLTP